MRVLIIDDDRLIGWVLQEICIQEGHEVSLVTDADRALHELESGPYDIVFADLETESVEARTIAGKLSLYQPGTSLILLSARSRPEFDFSINDVPFKGIIGKPFETATVRSWIETVQARIGERTGGSS